MFSKCDLWLDILAAKCNSALENHGRIFSQQSVCIMLQTECIRWLNLAFLCLRIAPFTLDCRKQWRLPHTHDSFCMWLRVQSSSGAQSWRAEAQQMQRGHKYTYISSLWTGAASRICPLPCHLQEKTCLLETSQATATEVNNTHACK